MKFNSQWFNLAVVGVLVVLAMDVWQPHHTIAAAPTPEITDGDCTGSRSIQVSGAAIVYVTPNRALIQLGVQSNGDTPDATQKANSQEIERVITAVQALGVESKDIASDYYIVYPVYEDFDSLFIKGYRIDNTVSITVRDVNLADDIIITALKAGANEVQDVQFYTSDLRKYRDQAREMAIKAAGEKAHTLAGAAGAEIGCVLDINENTWSQYYGSWRGSRQTAIWAQNVSQNASPDGMTQSDDSPISLGQIAVRAEVNASYSLN